MEYTLIIDASNGRFAVVTDTKPGLIGHDYKFKPIKARLVKDGYDQADFHYFRKLKQPIPEGTELMVDCWWQNFYGAYFKIVYNGDSYDVKENCVSIIYDR